MTLSITTLIICCNITLFVFYAKCYVFRIIMPSVDMLNVVMLNVVRLNVVALPVQHVGWPV